MDAITTENALIINVSVTLAGTELLVKIETVQIIAVKREFANTENVTVKIVLQEKTVRSLLALLNAPITVNA